MTDDGSSNILAFGLGLIAGGFFVYVILKSREPVQPATVSMSPPGVQPIIIQQHPAPQTYQVPPVPQPLVPQPPVPHIEAQALPSNPAPAPVMAIKTQAPEQSQKVQAFQNEEEWIVKKDDRGRLKGITVHRKVTPLE